MEILSAQALAKLSNDELLTLFIRRFPIPDPDSIVATRDQIVNALLRLRRAA